jgi:hypothetical protein
MNRIFSRRFIWITILIVACFVMLLPVIRRGLLVTDDQDWMVIRLSAFYQSFREGQFPVRLLGRLNYSYGYPVSNFQYPGLFYLGSLIHSFGVSFQSTIEIITIGFIVTGAIALFLWLRHFFDERASAIGVFSYIFMPYILYDIFKRGSIGEIVAINTCLIVLYAIETKRTWLMVPAFGFLAISHNTLALFLTPVLLGYVVTKKYWSLLPPFIIGVGMSSFFWLPAFFEKHLVIFDSVAVSDPVRYFPVSGHLFIISIPFIIAALLVTFFSYKKVVQSKEQWYFFGLLAVSSIMASGVTRILWQHPSFAKFIQFPFRFYSLWCFAGPWFIASLAGIAKDKRGVIISIVLALVLFVLSIPNQFLESIVRSEGFFTTNESTTTVANEYMPSWVNTMPTQRAPTRIEVVKGNVQYDTRHISTNTIDIGLHAKEESVIQINTIYYPGWGAIIDNKPVTISYDNPMGLMRITIPAGSHRLYMAFRETTSRFIADVFSFIFFVLYISIYVLPFLTRRKK